MSMSLMDSAPHGVAASGAPSLDVSESLQQSMGAAASSLSHSVGGSKAAAAVLSPGGGSDGEDNDDNDDGAYDDDFEAEDGDDGGGGAGSVGKVRRDKKKRDKRKKNKAKAGKHAAASAVSPRSDVGASSGNPVPVALQQPPELPAFSARKVSQWGLLAALTGVAGARRAVFVSPLSVGG